MVGHNNMGKKYPSKISYGLLIFIFIVFYGPLVPHLLLQGYDKAMLGILVFLTIAFGFVIHLFFATAYTVDDGKLHIRCGFITYRPIDICAITEISKTKSAMASPAASFDRIEIRYGKFDSVIISPKDQTGMVRHLLSINPDIKDQLLSGMVKP